MAARRRPAEPRIRPARRITAWLARRLRQLAGAAQQAAEALAAEPPPDRPAGPPEHWLEVVRRRAPQLLQGRGLGHAPTDPGDPSVFHVNVKSRRDTRVATQAERTEAGASPAGDAAEAGRRVGASEAGSQDRSRNESESGAAPSRPPGRRWSRPPLQPSAPPTTGGPRRRGAPIALVAKEELRELVGRIGPPRRADEPIRSGRPMRAERPAVITPTRPGPARPEASSSRSRSAGPWVAPAPPAPGPDHGRPTVLGDPSPDRAHSPTVDLPPVPATDPWPPLPAPAADSMIISRTPRPAGSSDPWPSRPPHPTDPSPAPADTGPVAAPAGRSVAVGPWPELPDDEVLWQAPRPERSADRLRRLDAEQRGA